ncbi:MAG TPA: NAD-dependent epimerase/dehydratase family protein [Fimbriimonas sp.]
MNKSALITGGAGFIGSHLADELLRSGYRVKVLDSLVPQVHGPEGRRPEYLSEDVELIVGDVRNPDAVKNALDGVDVVYHFAAIVGVGQSMYDIARYTEVNNVGTAVLLEALLTQPVERLVIASSMSLYGEGLYRRKDGTVAEAKERPIEQLKAQDWQVRDEEGNELEPVATPEWKRPTLPSIYALSKYDQERMCLMIGRAYGIPTVALRFFNAFGTRQALSNPYTGVLAIFGSRLLNDNRPLIFEDGQQLRDFVSVKDVARSCRLAVERDEAIGQAINIGSGMSYTIEQTALKVAKALGKDHLPPEICGKYRVGDVRHCFPDISLARKVLGYEPQIMLDDGLAELAAWLEEQTAEDRVEEMRAELTSRGLAL